MASITDSAGTGEVVSHTKASPTLKKMKPPKADEHAVEIRTLYNNAVRSIRPEIANYWINYAFLEGAQWVYWDEGNQRMMDMPRDQDRARITINRMATNTRTVMAKSMQREMVFEDIPNGADDAHIRGARLGETIIRELSNGQDWEVLRERLLQAVWKGGTAALCVDWDPQARDVLIPATDDGAPAVHEGDTCMQVLSIAEFVVEPGTRDPEKARWWIKALTSPPKEVQARYKLDWEPAADGFSATLPYMNRYTAGSPAENQSTMVLTYYERPNHLNKKGCIAVVVNDQIVHKADWPFPTKDSLNLFVARETVVENRWTGDTIVTYARPVQTALNATETNIMEHMKRAGNARLAVPQSSMDIIEALTDQPGELLPFSDGTSVPPQWLSPPQMPMWWNERPERLKETLDDLMGVHDVSRGQAPTNAPDSGYGLSILVEQDTTPVGRLVKETARIFGQAASFHLKLYEQEVKTKRTSAVGVGNNSTMQLEWDGRDLHGQTKVVIPADSVLPRSRAAQLKNAQDMMQMGMIQPGDVATYAFVAEMPDARNLIAAVAPQIAWARQENGLFAAGKMSTVEPWEDDESHIKVHNDYRSTMDYRLLAPEQRSAVDQHVQAHETSAAEKLGKRQAAMQVSPLLAQAPVATGAPPIPPDMGEGMAPPIPGAEGTDVPVGGAPAGPNPEAILSAMGGPG